MSSRADYQIICQRIREARKARGLRQTDMAEKLDISANAYGAFERGVKLISLRKLLDVCLILEVEPGQLLNDWYHASVSSADYVSLSPKRREVIEYAATCPEEILGALHSLTSYFKKSDTSK